MAEGRMLKKAIANSKKLALVSDRSKVIWFMLLPHTDVKGRVKACPRIVKGQYLTMYSYSEKAIQNSLNELHKVGLIVLYIHNDDQFLEYTRFSEFQSLKPDREAKSTIPASTPADAGSNHENSPLSKDKLSLSKDKDIESIFNHWNCQKEKGKWKTHTKLSPDITTAINDNLKKWPAEEICQAIDNFAKVLQGKEYLWTYDKWGLSQFLTRHEDDRKSRKWWRFHPNHFREDDYLTDAAKKKRIEQRKQYSDSINAATPEKIKENYAENKYGLNWLIEELRPEAVT